MSSSSTSSSSKLAEAAAAATAENPSLADLKEAVSESLEASGAMDKLRARLRAEVFQVLDEGRTLPKPELSNENLVINEMIRDYLRFNGYTHTLSVFMPDSGQPASERLPFDREFLAHELHVEDTKWSRQLPLLYVLLAQARSGERAVGDGDVVGGEGEDEVKISGRATDVTVSSELGAYSGWEDDEEDEE